jgi:hypothetical protein
MPILLTDLIKKLPSDTPDRVKAAKERFNNKIRESLRRETRLGLHRRQDDLVGGRDEMISVPITIQPGLPEGLQPLERQTIDDQHRLAVLLSPHRQALVAVRDSGKTLAEEMIPMLSRDDLGRRLLGGREGSFASAWQYADSLCQRLATFDLTKFILRVNEDVLGVYRYKVRHDYDDPDPKIELYWGVIGLIARDLGISVEDLASVVLAHELAHAYTHVGSDADDRYWNTRHFNESSVGLKEGLAQYYTDLVCQRLERDAPGIRGAYKKLLPKQPEAYHVQEQWKDSTPEIVRHAMLGIRRTSNDGSPETFREFLRKAEAPLGVQGRSQKEQASLLTPTKPPALTPPSPQVKEAPKWERHRVMPLPK